MNPYAKKAILICYFWFLFSAIAHADCAWIIWRRIDHFSSKKGEVKGSWEIERALTDVNQCGPMIGEFIKIKTQDEPHPSVEEKTASGDTTGIIILSGKDKDGNLWSFTTHYKCLPDSIDPRR